MAKVFLLNSAMLPSAGNYELVQIAEADFIRLVKSYKDDLVSFIGYPQNLEIIKKKTGLSFPFSRGKCEMLPGDVSLIMRLKYRVEGLKKGEEVSESDFEYFTLIRIR